MQIVLFRKLKCSQKKIKLSLFEDFFESSSPADYAKMLVNTKNLNENKEIVVEIEDRILDLNNRIKKMSETEKKMQMRHQRLLKKFLITIKMLKKIFRLHQKLIKEKQNQKLIKGNQNQKLIKENQNQKLIEEN